MTNNHAAMFLSKVIDTENEKAIEKHEIDRDLLISDSDNIVNYQKDNGQLPSYATLVDSVSDFNYIPGVTDGFDYLAENIRNRKLQVKFNEIMTDPKTSEYINDNKDGMEKVITTLIDSLESANIKYSNPELT